MVKCSLCEGNYDLDYCNSFLQLDLQERSKWLFHNKLCCGCLKAISVIHNVRNCKNRKKCEVCKKRHPTSLHGYKPEKSKAKQPDGNSSEESKVNVDCATANTKSDVISMCVVPVLVRHKISNYIVKTYKMLGNCSQVNFMRNKLLGASGLHGRKTSITVKTVNGEVKNSFEVLHGIEVAQASNESEEKAWVQLPSTYTQEDLPVDNREIAAAEKLKKWKYLDKLKRVMCVGDNQEVSLRNVENCVRTLEPREVVSSQNRGPYAFKTVLGWCIVGPMINQTKGGKFCCNKIILASADTVKLARHYFTVPTKVKETSIENMLKKIDEQDFIEPESQYSVNNKINLNYDNLSKNDRTFLELIEREAVKIDEHYQLPLPLKDKELVLANNRMAAVKRMQSLNKRFERYEPFYSQ